MNEVLKKISEIGIVPVIAINDVEKAVPLAKALVAGGIPCAEVTFRTAEAEEAIKRITAEVPEMLVGAGTVITNEQVDKAIAAGCKFIVSPGLNPRTVQYCNEKNIPITPGTANASDIEQAIQLGLEVVKFFPAEQAGGIAMIKALAAPYVNMKFMPTGGVNANNLNDYLSFGKVIACGGSWMVKSDLINNGEFEKITQLTKEAVKSMLGFELAHIGINTGSEEEALKVSNMFSTLFGMPIKNGNSSVFAGTEVEVMKTNYLGKNGHIAIKTNYMDRAIAYLKRNGIEVDMETAKPSKDQIKAVYLKADFGGFAVHLLQK